MRMSNVTRNYVLGCCHHLATVLITGSIIQTFMLESGITEQKVSLYISILQIVTMAANLLCAEAVDRAKKLARPYGFCFLAILPMYLAMIVICLFPGLPVMTKYYLCLGSGIFSNIAMAVIGIIGCKLPYSTLDMRDFGKIAAVSGMTQGIAGLIFVGILTAYLQTHDYFPGMLYASVIGILLLIVCVFLSFGFVENRLADNVLGEQKKINLLKYPPFMKLLLPNLLRGYASGTFGLLTTIGYYYHIIDSSGGAWMAIIADVFMLVGCLGYGLIVRSKKTVPAMIVSSAGIGLSMALILLGKSSTWFLAVYAFGYFFLTVYNFAIPVGVTQFVDYEVISQYSSWRLMLHSLGTALAGATCIGLLELAGGPAAMLINAVMITASGLAYFFLMRNMEKEGSLKFK